MLRVRFLYILLLEFYNCFLLYDHLVQSFVFHKNSQGGIIGLFSDGIITKEKFVKNCIRCTLITSNINVTLGFTVVVKAKPMTLLKGNELDVTKSQNLVLRKSRKKCNFQEILVGNRTISDEYK